MAKPTPARAVRKHQLVTRARAARSLALKRPWVESAASRVRPKTNGGTRARVARTWRVSERSTECSRGGAKRRAWARTGRNWSRLTRKRRAPVACRAAGECAAPTSTASAVVGSVRPAQRASAVASKSSAAARRGNARKPSKPASRAEKSASICARSLAFGSDSRAATTALKPQPVSPTATRLALRGSSPTESSARRTRKPATCQCRSRSARPVTPTLASAARSHWAPSSTMPTKSGTSVAGASLLRKLTPAFQRPASMPRTIAASGSGTHGKIRRLHHASAARNTSSPSPSAWPASARAPTRALAGDDALTMGRPPASPTSPPARRPARPSTRPACAGCAGTRWGRNERRARRAGASWGASGQLRRGENRPENAAGRLGGGRCGPRSARSLWD